MATKTWKIGEYSNFGIWKVNISKTKIMIQGIDYDTKKVEEQKTFSISKQWYPGMGKSKEDVMNDIMKYLEGYMSYGWADDITEYIRGIVFKGNE